MQIQTNMEFTTLDTFYPYTIHLDITKRTLTGALAEYPNYLYSEQKAKSTAESYQTDISLFVSFIKETYPGIRYVHEIKSNEIKSYIDFLLRLVENKKFSFNTAQRKLFALKTFYRFLSDSNFIKDNILDNYNWVNRNKYNSFQSDNSEDNIRNLPNFLEPYEIDMILASTMKSDERMKYRDVAILSMLRYLGCRRSEVLSLKWEDIHFYTNEITIKRRKTNNIDRLLMHKNLKKALLDYKATLGYKDISEYVFVSRQSNKLSKTAFNSIILKYVAKSGLSMMKNFPITAHTFRHSFITHAIRNNVPIVKIMRYTGHSRADSLDIYTHLVTTNLKDLVSVF